MQQKNTNILSKIFLKASPFHLHSQSSITHYKFQKEKKQLRYFHPQILVPTSFVKTKGGRF